MQFNKLYGKNNSLKCVCGPHSLLSCKRAQVEGEKHHYKLINNVLNQFRGAILNNNFGVDFNKKYSSTIIKYINNYLLKSHKTILPLIILVNKEEMPEIIEELIINKDLVKEEEVNLEKIHNMANILARYYYDSIVNDVGNDDDSNESAADWFYNRIKNTFLIKVAKETIKNNGQSFLCSNCKKNINLDSQIRLNCNHHVCTVCFNDDIEGYNTLDKENFIEYPVCSKCHSTVTHIYLTNEKNRDIYTPLEYGIKPLFLNEWT